MPATESVSPKEILCVVANQRYGTVSLTSGDLLIVEGQVFVEEPAQIAEIRKLIASGRVPHLRIKEVTELEREVAKKEAELTAMQTLLSRAAPRAGMTTTGQVPKGAPSSSSSLNANG